MLNEIINYTNFLKVYDMKKNKKEIFCKRYFKGNDPIKNTEFIKVWEKGWSSDVFDIITAERALKKYHRYKIKILEDYQEYEFEWILDNYL